MKKEGRQHGLILTYQMMPPPWNNQATDRMINRRLDDPPTAGMFRKVSPKPTNHSKFTSRCSRRPGCGHPVSKAKEKTKGTHKMRVGSGGVSDFSLVSGRVVDSGYGLQYSGSSASRFLDHLDDVGRSDVGEDEDGIVEESGLMGDPEIGSEDLTDDDEDRSSFYDVGLVWEQVYEDEGWCLVG